MKNQILIFALLLSASLGLSSLLTGCNGSTDTEANSTNETGVVSNTTDTSTNTEDGDPSISGEPAGTTAPPPKALTPFELPTHPMDAATLAGLLPKTIRGYELIGGGSRTNYQARVRYTYSENKFRNEDNQVLVYRLVDSHKTNVAAIVANAIIHQPNLDEDSDTVFELVSEISGYPAHIKVLKDRNIAKFQLMIEGRTLAELTGIGVSIEDLEPMLRFFDLGLIHDHTKEEIVQGQYKARQRLKAQEDARAGRRN